MKTFYRSLITLGFFLTILSTSFVGLLSNNVSALSGSEFQAGHIIDDGVFFNPYSMSTAQIQTFLNAKVPSCDTYGQKTIYDSANGDTVTRAVYSQRRGVSPPFTCLRDYSQTIPTTAANTYCSQAIAGGTFSAADIISKVSLACNINPQVLLVLLQKEQSLITDDWPWPNQYRSATGYGCPDTAACDSAYYGYFNQVYNAARQFRRYAVQAGSFNYVANRNNYIQYNPNASCGGSTIYIQNQATAGLYNYTPYQPNQAALNNLYGSGDSCSAYGNRNFWRIFKDWFGSTFGDLVKSSNGSIFKIENGTKRAFPNEVTFLSYGYQWGDVVLTSAEQLSQIPAGAAMPYNVHYRDGQLVTTDGSNIYLIVDGQKRNIPSESVFLSYSWKWSYVRTISAQEFNYIPAGAAMPYNVHYRDGQLVRAKGSTGIYLVQNGTKRAFPSAEIFLSYGHQWSLVTNISSEELGLMPVGQDLPYNVHYRDGQLITKDGNSIYLINNGQKRNIPSESVFLSYSWKWSYVRTISAQEFNYIPAGDPVPYNTNG